MNIWETVEESRLLIDGLEVKGRSSEHFAASTERVDEPFTFDLIKDALGREKFEKNNLMCLELDFINKNNCKKIF